MKEDVKKDVFNDIGYVEDPRFKQCNREAMYGVILGIANMIWWYALGYGLGDKPVEEYTYILGFPTWFFISCILGAVVFIVLTFIVVDKGLKDMSLDDLSPEEVVAYQEKFHSKEVQ